MFLFFCLSLLYIYKGFSLEKIMEGSGWFIVKTNKILIFLKKNNVGWSKTDVESVL